MPELPVALTDTQMGMPMTAGGIPFMCYKVQRIARLAQPAPEGGQPLLLSLPPGPPAGGLSLNDTPETGAPPATYGVWPSCAPAAAQLLLDIYGHATKQPAQPAFAGRGRKGHNFLWHVSSAAEREAVERKRLILRVNYALGMRMESGLLRKQKVHMGSRGMLRTSRFAKSLLEFSPCNRQLNLVVRFIASILWRFHWLLQQCLTRVSPYIFQWTEVLMDRKHMPLMLYTSKWGWFATLIPTGSDKELAIYLGFTISSPSWWRYWRGFAWKPPNLIILSPFPPRTMC